MAEFEFPTYVLLLSILVLTFMSAYFSSSETAMMKLNPYRLQYKVDLGHRGARLANRLLRRQDRLLGVILIGNNLVNNSAALVAGVICVRWFGEEVGYAIAAVGLTIYFLIFAEVAPKTIAAERPETIAYPSSYLLNPLLKILSPIVKLVNFFSAIVVKPFTARTEEAPRELSIEELRTVVDSGSAIEKGSQDMLLGILDLDKTTVQEVMVPRTEIQAIDLQDDDERIFEDVLSAKHARLLVLDGGLEQVQGVLHLRRAGRFMTTDGLQRANLATSIDEPYYVPTSTSLPKQLANFQSNRSQFAIVVDEYGDVKGIVTLQDILEEIVGEYTTGGKRPASGIDRASDDTVICSGKVLVRDMNQELEWELSTAGSKSLNGLVLEYLESIPEGNVGFRLNGYQFETLRLSEQAVESVKVISLPPELRDQEPDDDLIDEEDEPSEN